MRPLLRRAAQHDQRWRAQRRPTIREATPSRGVMKNELEVLLVDDDRVVRGILARVLRQAGLGVMPVASGAEALELLRSGRRFDVIVSDLVMPGLSGVALLQQVRRLQLEVPVIIVSGNTTAHSARVAMDLGSFRYLHKPVETSELIAAISDAAAKPRSA